MKVIKTHIEGVVVVEPKVVGDSRGYFAELFRKEEFDAQVRPIEFVQHNESLSHRGVVRGLHFQCGRDAQSKLVSVVRGKILDIAVDIRRGSPTFGRHVAVELSADNQRRLFIPRGFAHGFAVLSDTAQVQYMCDNYYAPESDRGILWCDAKLGIDWQIPAEEVILSDKDSRQPLLDEAQELFDYNDDLYV